MGCKESKGKGGGGGGGKPLPIKNGEDDVKSAKIIIMGN